MKEASKEILRFWKTQWEAYMKSMMAMQEQGETMLEMIRKSGVMQEGSQKMVKDWADKYKAIQKSYLDAVEDHFQKLDIASQRATGKSTSRRQISLGSDPLLRLQATLHFLRIGANRFADSGNFISKHNRGRQKGIDRVLGHFRRFNRHPLYSVGYRRQ